MYFVSFMVVLRIVLEHLRFLRVLERTDELVGPKLFAPLFVVDEPFAS